MRRILLVGGPARVGKSTLAKRVREHVDGQVVSGDALSRSIRETLNPDWIPDLYVDKQKFEGHAFNEISDEERIDILRMRDKAQWQFIKNYLYAATKESDDDIFIQGNLWPDYIKELTLEYRAAFLVDTSPDRAEFLRSIRDNASPDNHNNWMRERDYSDGQIERWAEFDIKRSQKIIELCQANNMAYFDIADHGISSAQELTLKYLIQENQR